MKAVTIDNLDRKYHERYAQDQELFDPVYSKESTDIPRHSEITGTSSIYSSKWEELFEIQLINISWGSFGPPPKYHVQSRRFFSYRIIPSIYVGLEEEMQEEKQNDPDQENPLAESDLIQEVLKIKATKRGTSHLVEKEKTAVLELLFSLKDLNTQLSQINSRKIQYQKG